jgi:hypothetical protein
MQAVLQHLQAFRAWWRSSSTLGYGDGECHGDVHTYFVEDLGGVCVDTVGPVARTHKALGPEL